MSGFDIPTKVQLVESCNAVEGVLEALHDLTNITSTNRSRIFSQVKALFITLQRLEGDEANADGAFHTADARARHNLAGILTSCGVVAGQLRKRINSKALPVRHDDGLGIELMTLTAEIEEFMKLRRKNPTATVRPKPGTASDSSALVEDLLRKQQKHESEVEALEVELRTLYSHERSFEQEIGNLNAEITAKDKLISGLENHNDAKLYQIRRLHAAISNLGLRHPMAHLTHDWDDLADELPTMVQRIENINIKLKELELERDRLKDQEHESELDMVPGGVSSVPRPPSAVNGSKPSNREKDKDKDQASKKKKEHRRSSDAKTSSKVRSPSPTSSEASKANTSKSVRRKSKSVHTGSGFFFGT